MKCEKFISTLLASDSTRLPIALSLHAFFCKTCRTEARRIKEILLKGQKQNAYDIPYDIAPLVMRRIALIEAEVAHGITSSRWIGVGVLLFGSVMLFAYSDAGIWLNDKMGSELEVPFNLVLGSALTIYAAFFIGSQLEHLREVLRIRKGR